MNATATMLEWRWTLAECHLIAQRAYQHGIDVEAWQVHDHIDAWRDWYHGIIDDDAVLILPGVCQAEDDEG